MINESEATMPEYFTDVELARRFSVSRICIWRWAGQGRFPKPVKLAPNCTRWRRQDVEAYEAGLTADASDTRDTAEAS